eukprot:PhF_6_TR12583/c0_g1_i4/m.19796
MFLCVGFLYMTSIPPNSIVCLQYAWDPLNRQPIDLDAAASVFDSIGLMLDCAYFNNTAAMQGAVTHSGDSLDGAASGVDEMITVNLGGLPPHVLAVIATVHCYEKGDFRQCESGVIHILVNNTPLLSHSIGGLGNNTSAVVLHIQRQADTTWLVTPNLTPLPSPIRTPVDALPSMLQMLKVDPALQKELSAQQPKLSLRKGDQLVVPVNMTHVGIGLGWDSQVDVDGSAICLRANGSQADLVYYRNLTGLQGNITHSGDNTTGVGSGDDETIKVTLSGVPPDVTHIFFVINVYSSGRSFADVQGEFARLLDFTGGRAGRELCRVNGMDSGNMNGFLFAVLYRNPKNPQWWLYKAVGEHAAGNTAQNLVDECQDYQRRQFASWASGGDTTTTTSNRSVPSTSGPSRQLRCSIESATNLKACDGNGLSDPYVKVMCNGSKVFKTKVIKKNLNPVWNESFPVTPGSVLQLVVMDEDLMVDDQIGEARVTVPQAATPAQFIDIVDKGVRTGQIKVSFVS